MPVKGRKYLQDGRTVARDNREVMEGGLSELLKGPLIVLLKQILHLYWFYGRNFTYLKAQFMHNEFFWRTRKNFASFLEVAVMVAKES